MSDFKIISGVNDARNLIYATWLRSYEANSLQTKNIKRDAFFAGHHRVLDAIFARDPQVTLAVLPDDESVVLGWAVTEPGVVHYCYVKPSFRRYGIAKALLNHVHRPFEYTHHTFILRQIPQHVEDCDFNPYRV